jgi:hypothetical protein
MHPQAGHLRDLNMNWRSLTLCRLCLLSTLAAQLIATACTQVPELDATVPKHLRNAAYPELAPLDASLTTPVFPQDQARQTEETLAARRDRLQARANALNAPVVDPTARQRMQNGINQ